MEIGTVKGVFGPNHCLKPFLVPFEYGIWKKVQLWMGGDPTPHGKSHELFPHFFGALPLPRRSGKQE